uniref:SUEL-type lectin domain-containing protein n=1 Tax=Ciona savignyi TaxID=51511 RepID=H2Z5C6_CIOSA
MNKILSTLVVVGVVVCMSASTISSHLNNATTTATTYPMNATSPTVVAPVNGTTPAAPFSCYQGYKVYVSRSGPLYQEVGTYAPCPPNDTQCDIAEYENVLPTNATVFVQFGRCSNPMTTTTCMGIQASNATQGRVKNCTVRVCTSSNCNAPPPVVSNQTCPHTPAGDVQVLPSCTLKQVLNKTFACMGPWFHGAPYADSTMCKSNLDTMTKCLSDVVVECLSGHCPSVLDAIPGARAFYPTIIHTAKKATSLRQALLLIPNITEPVIQL